MKLILIIVSDRREINDFVYRDEDYAIAIVFYILI